MKTDLMEAHETLLKTLASETVFFVSALNSDTWPNPNIFQHREWVLLVQHGLGRRDVCGLTKKGFQLRDELRDHVIAFEMGREVAYPDLCRKIIRERSVPRV